MGVTTEESRVLQLRNIRKAGAETENRSEEAKETKYKEER
jgi:hypothetical protein